MRLSHAAPRKYALIMSMRLLAAREPGHGKLTKMLCVCTRVLCDVTISTREYGPLLHEILQLKREDRNDGHINLATVCALRTQIDTSAFLGIN